MKPARAFLVLILCVGCSDQTESSSQRDALALAKSHPERLEVHPAEAPSGGSVAVILGAQSFKLDTWQGVLRLYVGSARDFGTLQLGGSARTGQAVGVTLAVHAAAGQAQLLGQHLLGDKGPLGVENGVLLKLDPGLYRATEGSVEIASHSAGKIGGMFSGGFQSFDASGGLPSVRIDFAGLLQVVCMVPLGSARDAHDSEPLNWIQVEHSDERCRPYLGL